jgi:hypothetical protein
LLLLLLLLLLAGNIEGARGGCDVCAGGLQSLMIAMIISKISSCICVYLSTVFMFRGKHAGECQPVTLKIVLAPQALIFATKISKIILQQREAAVSGVKSGLQGGRPCVRKRTR